MKEYTNFLIHKDINEKLKKIAEYYDIDKIELLRRIADREIKKIEGENNEN